eukprot:TRINITY_DN1946_c0_g1_i1.p1 TRINITY_DN1946_c0_g1~~TRINITY_DN1946_c0_g1_i1.p1  ORF type:complete len:1141 (-),score=317.36 TRINITY_DN1946_c0_g1_i1:67-3393(-)
MELSVLDAKFAESTESIAEGLPEPLTVLLGWRKHSSKDVLQALCDIHFLRSNDPILLHAGDLYTQLMLLTSRSYGNQTYLRLSTLALVRLFTNVVEGGIESAEHKTIVGQLESTQGAVVCAPPILECLLELLAREDEIVTLTKEESAYLSHMEVLASSAMVMRMAARALVVMKELSMHPKGRAKLDLPDIISDPETYIASILSAVLQISKRMVSTFLKARKKTDSRMKLVTKEIGHCVSFMAGMLEPAEAASIMDDFSVLLIPKALEETKEGQMDAIPMSPEFGSPSGTVPTHLSLGSIGASFALLVMDVDNDSTTVIASTELDERDGVWQWMHVLKSLCDVEIPQTLAVEKEFFSACLPGQLEVLMIQMVRAEELVSKSQKDGSRIAAWQKLYHEDVLKESWNVLESVTSFIRVYNSRHRCNLVPFSQFLETIFSVSRSVEGWNMRKMKEIVEEESFAVWNTDESWKSPMHLALSNVMRLLAPSELKEFLEAEENEIYRFEILFFLLNVLHNQLTMVLSKHKTSGAEYVSLEAADVLVQQLRLIQEWVPSLNDWFQDVSIFEHIFLRLTSFFRTFTLCLACFLSTSRRGFFVQLAMSASKLMQSWCLVGVHAEENRKGRGSVSEGFEENFTNAILFSSLALLIVGPSADGRFSSSDSVPGMFGFEMWMERMWRRLEGVLSANMGVAKETVPERSKDESELESASSSALLPLECFHFDEVDESSSIAKTNQSILNNMLLDVAVAVHELFIRSESRLSGLYANAKKMYEQSGAIRESIRHWEGFRGQMWKPLLARLSDWSKLVRKKSMSIVWEVEYAEACLRLWSFFSKEGLSEMAWFYLEDLQMMHHLQKNHVESAKTCEMYAQELLEFGDVKQHDEWKRKALSEYSASKEHLGVLSICLDLAHRATSDDHIQRVAGFYEEAAESARKYSQEAPLNTDYYLAGFFGKGAGYMNRRIYIFRSYRGRENERTMWDLLVGSYELSVKAVIEDINIILEQRGIPAEFSEMRGVHVFCLPVVPLDTSGNSSPDRPISLTKHTHFAIDVETQMKFIKRDLSPAEKHYMDLCKDVILLVSGTLDREIASCDESSFPSASRRKRATILEREKGYSR